MLSASGIDSGAADETPIPVDMCNFARAETDMYLIGFAKEGSFGKFSRSRTPASARSMELGSRYPTLSTNPTCYASEHPLLTQCVGQPADRK